MQSERGQEKWRKIYGGKIYSFRGTYDECLVAWHRKLAEIELAAEEAEGHHVKLCRKMHDWFKAHPGEWERAGGRHPLSNQYDGPTDEKAARLQWRAISDGGRAIWAERFRLMDAEQTKPHAVTVAMAVARFLEKHKTKVELGQISAGRYDTLARCANHFAAHLTGQRAITTINGLELESYYNHLTQEMKANKWSLDYTLVYLIVAKQFVRWAWETELIESLPRNLHSLRFTVKAKKVPTIPIDEATVLINGAVDRTKLFLLLMANCGFTQKDISDLSPDEVTWEKGLPIRITRARSKTRDKGAPEISYPLWDETSRLLQKFGNRKGTRVLTNERGGTLKTEELVEGKLRKVDNIAVAYHRLCTKLKKAKVITKKRPLKLFRKTSPSLLQSKPEFAMVAFHFLGHSPRGMALRHYIAPSQEVFDKAVMWLGTQYLGK